MLTSSLIHVRKGHTASRPLFDNRIYLQQIRYRCSLGDEPASKRVTHSTIGLLPLDCDDRQRE